MNEPKRVQGYTVSIECFIQTNMLDAEDTAAKARAVVNAQKTGSLKGLSELDDLTVMKTTIKHGSRDREAIDAIRFGAKPEEAAKTDNATGSEAPAGDGGAPGGEAPASKRRAPTA